MKRIQRLWRAHWRTILLGGIVTVFLGLLLLSRLSSVTNEAISDTELQQQLFSSSWHHIAHNPLYLPLTGLQWLILTVFNHHGATVTRLASVVFGLLTITTFAYILRRWYGVRTALYGSTLFACSAVFLHVSRYAGTDILYLWAVPTLLAAQILWERHSQRLLLRLLVVFALALLLYIPGMIWFIILALGLQPYLLVKGWQQIGSWLQRSLTIILFIALLLPLIIAGIHTPALVQTWLGLPHTYDVAINVVKRLGLSVSFLFYRGPQTPDLWLDRLPILGIFEVVMCVLGIFFYLRHITAPRTRQLLGLFVVGAIFFALQGPVKYSVLVPLVYLVVTAGIGYLLHEWLHVFPRNPLARNIGYGLLGLAILLACSYNLRSYFIAWPHNNATQTVFIHRQ